MSEVAEFLKARDQLLKLRGNYTGACSAFRWPNLHTFNWATEYFDSLASTAHPALHVVTDTGVDEVVTYGQLARGSNQVANLLFQHGVRPTQRVLVMLPNVVPLWETLLGSIKSGTVMIPATPLLTRQELADRLERGAVRAIVAESSYCERFSGLMDGMVGVAVGPTVRGWIEYARIDEQPCTFDRSVVTHASDPMLLYFTSGTTAKPKLVQHTHASYPVGHLSTMFWLGLQPGDVHLNLSSPGWAKHAWSSVFAPWNAGATVVAYRYERFQPQLFLEQLKRCAVTSLCAPPTVWRMLIREELGDPPPHLRELTSAGEPLNPEVIARVRQAWGLTVRDGFGQTETTALIGNTPGERLKPGSMGRPLPGYEVTLLDSQGAESEEGEVCIDLHSRPIGVMTGYLRSANTLPEATTNRYYHTGDIASRDGDGYLTYVGRVDDVFKASDYRISPFELESVLVEHAAVAEAAVVPSPDPLRLAVPKAYVVLGAGHLPTAATAKSIFTHVNGRVSPYQRIRRLEFAELPKTISGKIRRVELRSIEISRSLSAGARRPHEFFEEDVREVP
jgi:acetyl-CoA synthetase